MRSILVIEDDAAIRHGVVLALRSSGAQVVEAGDGDAARRMIRSAHVDLVLLDLVLPGADGLDLLRQIRAERHGLPVIILTARGDEQDRVAGLSLGADDYVVKPFGVAELLARVDAVLRRSPERPRELQAIPLPAPHAGSVDLARREACFADGSRCELTERECELLAYLARHPGRAISRAELLERVWRLPTQGETRTIDMHVLRLREKLRDSAEHPRLILTVRGLGYQFAKPGGAEPRAAP